MRRPLLLALPALLLISAAPNPDAFQRKCRTGAPVATCNCVVEKLRQTQNGQITLDVFRLMEMPKDQQQALAVELANKYETTLSGVKTAVDNTKAIFDAAIQSCL